MGNWGIWDRLDFLDIKYPQVGEPAVESKQRIMRWYFTSRENAYKTAPRGRILAE